MLLTRYDDHESYAPALRETILKRAGDPSLSHHVDDDNGQHCIKAFDLEKWDSPEAALINARALTMFRRAIKDAKVIVDACWASVYRKGNFVLPHSHAGSIASVLHILEPGVSSGGMNGHFLFVDPRLKACCRQQDGFVTTPCSPVLRAGTTVMFPAQTVHLVTPYFGDHPRITLSWDLKLKSAPSAVPAFITRPA